MEFKISYILEEKEYISLNHGLFKYRSKNSLSKAIWIVCLIIIIIIALLLIPLSDGSYPPEIIFSLFFIIGCPWLAKLIRENTYKKTYRATPIMHLASEYSFSENSVKVSTSLSQTEIPWSSFTEFITIENYILLMTSKMTFASVPLTMVNKDQTDWIKDQFARHKTPS